jgi:hypothetical protein
VTDDELSLACQNVGLFFHKFALLEQEINERIVDILDLKGDAANLVVGNLAFFKKLTMLKIVAENKAPPADAERVREIFKAIDEQNQNRNIMAHCPFEPENGPVRFRRTYVKDGKLKADVLWSAEKFKEEFKKLDDLSVNLGALKPRLTFKIGDDGTTEIFSHYFDSPLALTSSFVDLS